MEVVSRQKSGFLLRIVGQFDTLWHQILYTIQAAFGSKNWDKWLKFRMQPPIVARYPDHKEIFGSDVINLHQNQDFAEYPAKNDFHLIPRST